MNGLADLDRLDADLRGIRDVHPDLLLEVLALDAGPLSERVAGLGEWRAALLQGRLPPPNRWPGEAIAGPVRRALESMDLVRFLRDQPALVDALMLDIARGFAGGEADFNRALRAELARLEAEETELAAAAAKASKGKPAVVRRELSAIARALVLGKRQATRDDELVAGWGERARTWASLSEVFGELGDLLGLGWDLVRGLLRHRGWAELESLRRLVAALPELRTLVESLGRLRARDEGPSISESVVEAMVREVDRRVAFVAPGVPPEIHGVERSGELARMLPQESAYLGHPMLKWLWHARRAERALLTYAVQGVVYGRETITERGERTIERPKPKVDKGPMIVCLDTSGSMAGARETVAKAVVLEVLRTAIREKRRAFVYLFSGPGNLSELELELGDRGLPRLLDFIACSFHGGTDVDAPLRAAVERLRRSDWTDADVLLVSDGEFPVPDALASEIRKARADQSARFHGLLVGGHAHAMEALCDRVHRFTSWSAMRS